MPEFFRPGRALFRVSTALACLGVILLNVLLATAYSTSATGALIVLAPFLAVIAFGTACHGWCIARYFQEEVVLEDDRLELHGVVRTRTCRASEIHGVRWGARRIVIVAGGWRQAIWIENYPASGRVRIVAWLRERVPPKSQFGWDAYGGTLGAVAEFETPDGHERLLWRTIRSVALTGGLLTIGLVICCLTSGERGLGQQIAVFLVTGLGITAATCGFFWGVKWMLRPDAADEPLTPPGESSA